MFASGGSEWPDSRTAFWKPGLKNGARRRKVYEDRNARISILAGLGPRPDTLKQTDHGALEETTCNGAGHTFSKRVVLLRFGNSAIGKAVSGARRVFFPSEAKKAKNPTDPPDKKQTLRPVCRWSEGLR